METLFAIASRMAAEPQIPAIEDPAAMPVAHRMVIAGRIPRFGHILGNCLMFFPIMAGISGVIGLDNIDFFLLTSLGMGLGATGMMSLATRGLHMFSPWNVVLHSCSKGMNYPYELQEFIKSSKGLSGRLIEHKIGRGDTLAMAVLTHRIATARQQGANSVKITGESSELLARVLEALKLPERPRVVLV